MLLWTSGAVSPYPDVLFEVSFNDTMSTPPAPPAPRQIILTRQQQEAADELRKQLARYDAYKKDTKEVGEVVAGIKFSLADMIDSAGKHWCGNWMQRECHAGGRLGEKCKGHNCGSYMTTHYDSDPNGKAKFDEWFANTDYYVVVIMQDVVTKEKSYCPREKWW